VFLCSVFWMVIMVLMIKCLASDAIVVVFIVVVKEEKDE